MGLEYKNAEGACSFNWQGSGYGNEWRRVVEWHREPERTDQWELLRGRGGKLVVRKNGRVHRTYRWMGETPLDWAVFVASLPSAHNPKTVCEK